RRVGDPGRLAQERGHRVVGDIPETADAVAVVRAGNGVVHVLGGPAIEAGDDQSEILLICGHAVERRDQGRYVLARLESAEDGDVWRAHTERLEHGEVASAAVGAEPRVVHAVGNDVHWCAGAKP